MMLCSNVPSSLLSQLLRSCEIITNFQYVHGYSTSDPQNWYSDILAAASLHSDTIEEIILRTENEMSAPWRDRWPQLSLFANMENLTRLEISYTVLMGKPEGLFILPDFHSDPTWPGYTQSLHDLLPSSLIKLSLQYRRTTMPTCVDYTQQLRDLIRDGSSRHSKLETIYIDYYHDEPAGRFPLQLATLDRYFNHQGVGFKYLIGYTMDDERRFLTPPRLLLKADRWNTDEANSIIETLVEMGLEGVKMAGHFADAECVEVIMDYRELYETVFKTFLRLHDREDGWDSEIEMMRQDMGWDYSNASDDDSDDSDDDSDDSDDDSDNDEEN
jgi:hypothetical protein